MVPVFLALAFGQGLVDAITTALNGDLAWLGTGLTVAGGMLPAVGFAILLRYLPVKKHIAYLILGFIIAALLGTAFSSIVTLGTDAANLAAGLNGLLGEDAAVAVGGGYKGLSMLTIALIGFALAYIYYKQSQAAPAAVAAGAEGDDDDEL